MGWRILVTGAEDADVACTLELHRLSRGESVGRKVGSDAFFSLWASCNCCNCEANAANGRRWVRSFRLPRGTLRGSREQQEVSSPNWIFWEAFKPSCLQAAKGVRSQPRRQASWEGDSPIALVTHVTFDRSMILSAFELGGKSRFD